MKVDSQNLSSVVMAIFNKAKGLKFKGHQISNQRFVKYKVSKPMILGEVAKASGFSFCKCLKYGRIQGGNCRRGTSACYECGKTRNKIYKCPSVANKGREGSSQGKAAQRGKYQMFP